MKLNSSIFLLSLFSVPALAGPLPATRSAAQILTLSEQQGLGNSLQAEMKMLVEKDDSTRNMEMKVWYYQKKKSVIKILKPEKDRDTGNLRLDLNLWQFLPNLDKIIKIPPSMMLQNWMGSDFTNDDLVKTSSLARDYNSQIEGKETIDGVPSYKISCKPKPTAPVTWGKVLVWVRANDYVTAREEFYTENGELVKSLNGTKIKTYGTHHLPSVITMVSVKKNSKTTIEYVSAIFDQPIAPEIFSQEFLRKPAKH